MFIAGFLCCIRRVKRYSTNTDTTQIEIHLVNVNASTRHRHLDWKRHRVCAANDTTIFNKRKFTRFHRTIKLHTGNQNGFFLSPSHSCARQRQRETERKEKVHRVNAMARIETNCKLAKWRLKEWKWISINPNWHRQYCKWICNVLLICIHPSSFDSARLEKFTQKSSCRAFAISEPRARSLVIDHTMICFVLRLANFFSCFAHSVHLLLLFLNLAEKQQHRNISSAAHSTRHIDF